MNQADKCVVSLNDKNVRFVEAIKATQEQRQVLQQHTWAQYLLAKYFANKNDIIDRSKCDQAPLQNELSKTNICINAGSVLESLQILASSLHLLSKQVQVDTGNKTGFLKASAHETGDSISNHIIQQSNSEKACDKRVLVNNLELSDEQSNREKETPNLKSGCNSVNRQYRHQQLVLLLFIVSVIISFNNALPCSGFMYPLRYDNTGFIGYNYVSFHNAGLVALYFASSHSLLLRFVLIPLNTFACIVKLTTSLTDLLLAQRITININSERCDLEQSLSKSLQTQQR